MEAPFVRLCELDVSGWFLQWFCYFLYPAALLLQGSFQKAFIIFASTAASHSAAHSAAIFLVYKWQGEPAVHQLMLKQVSFA